MAFAVFMHRVDSIYDDRLEVRYQFPRQYLGRARECIGDWIVYYEPRKVVDTRGYFAVAKVQSVVPDPVATHMYIANIEPGSYLDFAVTIPFTTSEGLIERGLLNEHGNISGRAQAAIRPLAADDFYRIIEVGRGDGAVRLPRVDDPSISPGLQEPQVPFWPEEIRDRTSFLTSRIVRDRVFRRAVLNAYDSRCAVTGLRLINGGGRAEVEAAHIRPVQVNGPDTVRNGLALSGTIHWMFDRGLISIADDSEILISRQVNNIDEVRNMLNRSGHILVPSRPIERPHPDFLKWHRENCFKL